MARQAESMVTITAKEAVELGGLKKVLASGLVYGITPHHKRTVTVSEVVQVDNKETVIKNRRGKRRVIGTGSIANLTVSTKLTQIQPASQ